MSKELPFNLSGGDLKDFRTLSDLNNRHALLSSHFHIGFEKKGVQRCLSMKLLSIYDNLSTVNI